MANLSKSPKSNGNKVEDAVEIDLDVSEDSIDPDVSSDTDVAVAATDDVHDIEDTPAEAVSPDTNLDAVEPQKKSVFLPLLLGGVAAGAIGYGLATYFQPKDNSAQIIALLDAQADQISDLQAQLDNFPVPDVSDQIATGLEDVTGHITDIQSRLEQVERQPNADGTLSETALAAYEAEIDALRSELNDQQSAVMSAASQAGADLAAARAEAERLEQDALAAAQAAVARAAINRIATAVDTGAPFANALADLNSDDISTALQSAAESGVATNAQLTSDFPAVARAALATARSEGASDDAGGIGGFLRSQFDVRSTTPQEGPGPDAVLSRAEAAVKEGRVADALAEIDALPEIARAEITDWTAQAQERVDVLDAIAILSETYQ